MQSDGSPETRAKRTPLGETEGVDAITSAPTDVAGTPAPPKSPIGKRILRWLLALLALTVLGIFAYRWAGTSTLRGTVQRVYEKEAHYRIEFIESSGEVHVVENEEIRFPHFKTDTADLQAELHRYSETGDIVDLTTWGFRASWFSVFPNAVDVDFVRSNQVRQKKHVDYLTQSVIDELIDQGVVQRGEESERMRPGLSKALEKATTAPPPAEEESDASPADSP